MKLLSYARFAPERLEMEIKFKMFVDNYTMHKTFEFVPKRVI